MAGKKKLDGIVESVRLGEDGLAKWLRVYMRRGPTWSDLVMVNRDDLIAQITGGKKFAVGKRIQFQATDFEVGQDVTVVERNGMSFLTSGNGTGKADSLAGIPTL